MNTFTSQLAVQMYTVRDFTGTAAGLADTLAQIRAIGYPAVQLSAVGAMGGDSPAVSAQEARRMLDDNGLRCIATHRSWDTLAQETEREIAFHQTLGCDFAAIGSLPQPYAEAGAAGYADWARDAAPVIARLKDAGIRFGYHNHAHEFERVGGNEGVPRTRFDILIEDGGPDLCLELDLYWVSPRRSEPGATARTLRGPRPRDPRQRQGNRRRPARHGPGRRGKPGLAASLARLRRRRGRVVRRRAGRVPPRPLRLPPVKLPLPERDGVRKNRP